jgi:hypothetical protein
MMGLVFTRKVAFATVVSFTASMKVAKWKLKAPPERRTSNRPSLGREVKLRLEMAKETMTTAAMSNLKKVSEIAEASVANLMKIALEPKKMDATKRISGPLEGDNSSRILYHICCRQSTVA